MPGERSPRAISSSLTDRIKGQAKATGQPYERLQRRFVLTRFLIRVFASDPDGWLLKGGTGMMIRLPEARHSKDIDLMAASVEDAGAAYAKLVELVNGNPLDPFAFEIGPPKPLSDEKGISLSVIARLGTQKFDTFTIDLVTWHGVVGAVEHHSLDHIPDTPDFPSQTTQIRLYPIADQIADKLCALYETREAPAGPIASTRYRDLVDLLLMAEHLTFPLAETVAATEYQRVLRREMILPAAIAVPGPQWASSWRNTARDSPLSADLHDFSAALATCARCYDLVLSSLPTAGDEARWSPAEQRWLSVQ